MPRSPSRDLLVPHDGDRGYFRRPTWIARTKFALAALGAAFAIAWALVDARAPGGAARAHSPGALARPHAMWDSDCAACHVSFSASGFGLGSLFRAGERWHAVTCEKCHAGPAHHRTVGAEGQAFHDRCANCHRDHGGASNALARVPDAVCVRCHGNLTAHSDAPVDTSPSVTAFATDHPEFAVVRAGAGKPSRDQRTLKFSHALHMTPGQAYREGSKAVWTLRQLADLSGPEARERYARPGDGPDAPVKLECSSCHGSETLGTRAAPNGDGAHFRPVSFEAHCRSCHPVRAPAGVSGTVVVPAFDVPHGPQPAELTGALASGYARHALDERNRFAATPLGPSGRFDPRANPELVTFKGEVSRLERAARATLFAPAPPPGTPAAPARGAACSKCHDLEPRGAEELPRVLPLTTPSSWFSGAKFNHASHRAVTCASCHPGTGAGFFGTDWTHEKEPLRIAGVASCQQCHGPRRSATPARGDSVEIGGARHACVDCHRYHNGDHAQRGRAAGRDPAHRVGVRDFIQGKR